MEVFNFFSLLQLIYAVSWKLQRVVMRIYSFLARDECLLYSLRNTPIAEGSEDKEDMLAAGGNLKQETLRRNEPSRVSV